MLKDTKSLGNNKAPACESRGFVLKKKVCFLTHLHEKCGVAQLPLFFDVFFDGFLTDISD